MMQDIINSLATCNIFWTLDFKNWRPAVSEIYSEIPSVSNYQYFSAFSMWVSLLRPRHLQGCLDKKQDYH